MPGLIEAVTFIVLAAQAGALGTGLLAVGAAYSGILLGAASIGVSYLAQALMPRPQAPKPEDVQVTIKSPTSPRLRHYGRVKISGTLAFLESKDGHLFKVIALGTGQLDAIEEYWVDDRVVTLDVDGWATAPSELEGEVRIRSRLGLPTETHYSELETEFSEWDEDHRGDGVSSLFAQQHSVKASNFSNVFPNGAQTLFRVVARGSLVYNPATDTTEWSENAADIIRDYMTHADGMRLPSSMVETPLAAAGWLAAHNKCAEAVTLKAGGTVERYKISGSYRFDERPGDVLVRMLDACDGRIIPTPDGGFTLDVGDWSEPTVILDASAIAGFSDLTRGRNVLETANVIRATFASPNHDYQLTDADQWIDEADVSARGEYVQDFSYSMVPNHSQARRLMKLAAYRANPNWIVTLQCNLKGLAAFGERFVRITYPLFGIDEVFEVEDFRFNFGEGNILIGCSINLRSMPEDAYEWDAATEEGTAPASEDITVDRTIPTPTGFTFTEGTVVIAGQNYSVGVITFDIPPSESLTVEGRYKKVSDPDSAWQVIPISPDSTSAQTGVLEDGVEYEAQVRHVTVTGRVGDWTASATMTPLSNPTPPEDLVSVSLTGSAPYLGNAPFQLVTQNDDNLRHVAMYRVASGGVLDRETDLVLKIPVNTAAATYSYVDGDSTRTNIPSNPNFDTDTVWGKINTTISGGVANKAAGSSGSVTQAVSVTPGQTYRAQVVATRTAGSASVNLTGGTTTALITGITSSNTFRGSGVAQTGNNTLQILGGSTYAGTWDNVILFEQTAGCAPQGVWDYYFEPLNPSGVAGSLEGPISVTIV